MGKKQEKTSVNKGVVENNVVRDENGRIISGTPNPNGRPKGSGISITTELKRKLQERAEGDEKTNLELLVEKVIHKAIVDGDEKTIRQLWNHIDGMPKQKIEAPPGANPYQNTFVSDPVFHTIVNIYANNQQIESSNPEKDI